MAQWVFDTNILVYIITRDSRYIDQVQAKIDLIEDEGHTVYLPTVIIAEAVYVLEGRDFHYTRDEAARALEQVITTRNVECQDIAAVLYGLEMHREKGLDFVDGYCAGLAKEPGIVLLTNDHGIIKFCDCNFETLETPHS